ncbi:MAG: polyketide cyclase [Actinobacteria bacterium 13_2_20CM_2_71_6]|nr:MAG: polyketide cyclase [Actinobacteria bacterium 13_2_20CM_2_71_6]
MSDRSVTHDTFVIERTYDASPARVFAAWSDPKVKARWFVGPDEWLSSDHELDFRVGGRERVSGGTKDGPVFSFDARYQDIVPNERIVTTYDMHMDETRISVSLATVEFQPAGTGTRLVYTEQGAYLDGHDTPAQREHGTRDLLEALDTELRRAPANT